MRKSIIKITSLFTLLIISLIVLITKAFKMNFKMGFYKFSTTLRSSESVRSLLKSKIVDKLKENKPNYSDKEYYSFLK